MVSGNGTDFFRVGTVVGTFSPVVMAIVMIILGIILTVIFLVVGFSGVDFFSLFPEIVG